MKLDQKKWMAYAAAGTAAAFTTATAENDAFADIHYSGIVNISVAGTTTGYFNVVALTAFADAGTTVALARHGFFSATGASGAAQFGAFGQVAGTAPGFIYASKLAYGLNVSTLPNFNPASYFNTLAWGGGYTLSQWLAPGQGYLAFTFDLGAGTQFAWARLDMTGSPNNSFTIVDWAYGDVGQALKTGQISAIPEAGSLGALALGAVGLLSWRRSRRKDAQVAA